MRTANVRALPDISGNASGKNYKGASFGQWAGDGAFYGSKALVDISLHDGASGYDKKVDGTLSIGANRSSSIFGSSATVQPSSVRLLPIIKA